MHIVHVVENARGGISTYVDTLVRQQLQHGHTITLISNPARSTPELRALAVNHLHYDCERTIFKLVKSVSTINRHIDQIAPDIVHLHSTFPGLFGRLYTRKRHKVVYCAHGWAFCQDIPWIMKLAYAVVERVLALRTDAIINISQSERVAAEQWNVAGRHYVVRNAVEPASPTGQSVIQHHPTKINLGFIGRHDRQKGLDFILDILDRNPSLPVHLWVAGEHDREGKRRGSDGGNYSFVGWVDKTRTDDFICDMDAIIIPSRWEGFGLVALEAMRNGKPVLASDRGGLGEFIINDYNGYIFTLDSARDLTRLLQGLKREALAQLGANGRHVFDASSTFTKNFLNVEAIYADITRPVVSLSPSSTANNAT